MRLLRACAFGVLAAGAVACSKDLDGELVTPEPLAGLRYVHVVPDTGAMDFRVIDIVGNAPNQIRAVFRTGGTANGAPQVAGTLPLHQGVAAGARHIRVFGSDTNAAIASIVIFDTTVTLTANVNYTFFLSGYSRTGQTPAMNGTLVVDDALDPGAGRVSVRVVNLAPTFAGGVPAPANPAAAPDVYFRRIDSASATGTPTFTGTIYGSASSYVTLDTATFARLTLTDPGTANSFFAAALPAGTAGSSTVNPIPGSLIAGTAFTAVLVPQSLAGSTAPQGGAPTLRTSQEFTHTNNFAVARNGTRTQLENRTGGGADTVTATTGTASANAARGDVIGVTGATQPEYNGWHQVLLVLTDTLISCTPVDAADTFNNCAAADVTALYHTGRFRFRITGSPVSPSTGTEQFRAYPPTATGPNMTAPNVLYLIDRLPTRTAP